MKVIDLGFSGQNGNGKILFLNTKRYLLISSSQSYRLLKIYFLYILNKGLVFPINDFN